MVRTELARKCGGFDESFSSAADWDLWLRLAARGRAAAVAQPLVAYSRHPGATALSHAPMVQEDADRLMRKHVDLAKRLGDQFDRSAISRSVAHSLWWSGRRSQAARTYLRTGLNNGDPGALVRAAGAFLPPRAVKRFRIALGSDVPDPDWLAAYRLDQQTN